MGRLRDYASIVACLGEEEIDRMQAAIDARREARAEEEAEVPEDERAAG